MAHTKLILASAGALAFTALALALSTPASAATYNVSITEYQFTPQNLTVYVGDTVNWTNAGTMGHDVTFQAGFSSGSAGGLAVGQSFVHTFTAVGVYKYHCDLHAPLGYDPPNGMIGRITVLDSASGPKVSITSAPSSPVGPNTTITLSGAASDNTSIVAVRFTVDGGPAQNATAAPAFDNDTRLVDWTLSLNSSALGPGNHTVEAYAWNGVDNSTAATAGFVVLAAAPPPPPLSPPATWTIQQGTNPPQFLPAFLEVASGDTVTFLNNATIPHDVLFEAGFGTGAPGSLPVGQSWSFTFNSTGTFRFRCQLHSGGFGAGMSGEIVVYDAALRPAVNVTTSPPSRITLGAPLTLSGNAADNAGITAVLLVIDGGTPSSIPFTNASGGDARLVNWSANVTSLLAGAHTLSIFASNGVHNSTLYSLTVTVAAASGPTGPPSGNPFGGTFVFEDILANYFWLIVGISVILIAVLMMFLSYSGKLQNYYIFLLTALDERHRFFAFARPTREFLYTIQRQMPRTHTERYNLKVIWYWYPLYCLGGLSFAAFIILTITGIILGFYYIPEGTGPNTGVASPAYVSMQTIMTKVTFGYIFRALHHWGAHMMVAAVFLHMMRVYFVGAYKNPRELNWLLGVILLNVTLLFGYTGYLLPWDQLSFWAGQIGLEMANTIPVIGEILGNMVFGGPELSPATVIRMYYLHVFVLPLIGGALMVLHMGIVWMQGVAEPH